MRNLINFIVIFVWAIGLCSCTPNQLVNNLIGQSWSEEAKLHDGTSMIIKRSQTYKGYHEIGQSTPVGSEKVVFKVRQTGKSYTWVTEYSEKFGRAELKPLAVHVFGAVPYVVATPNLCYAYNAYDRPNPPYIVFKNIDIAWERIPLSELPKELTTINVLIEPYKREVNNSETISAETIKKLNSNPKHPEYKAISREPITKGAGLINCPDWRKG